MKHILCICLGIWIFLPGCSVKKKGDKSVQELYDLNKKFVELERSRDQAVYLTESEYANKMKILNDRKFEMENRKNRNSGFFDRIASAVGAEPTPSGNTADSAKNQGLTEKYNILYQVLHGEQDAEFSANRPDIEYTISDSFLRSQTIYPNTNVFGWHPYWMNGAYQSYNFNLLTHIAYFAYDVAPNTGNYRNPEAINSWKSTALVDSAHKHNCKVLLTVSNHGRINNEIFLTNPIAQEVLIDSLLFLLRYRDADGIDLNFEAIPQGMSYAFSAFVTKLHGRLALAPKDYLLTVCVPAIDPGVFDVRQLQNYVDFFLIMGYDLHSKRSKIAGPVSPLQNGDTWKGFTLKNSIASYLSKGVLRQKLILALPYYGAMWETSSPEPGSPAIEFIRHLTYKEITSNYLNNPDATIKDFADPESDSRYFVFKNPGKETYTQCWYDDSTTLDTKMDFLQQQGLGGVGFWALGFDNGLHGFWRLVSNRFGANSAQYVSNMNTQRRFSVIGWIRQYQSPLLAGGIFILLFLVLGFLLSLTDWKVRDALFYSGGSRVIYAGLVFSLLIFVFAMMGIVTGKVLLLVAGLAFGLVVTMLINKLTLTRRRTLP